MPPPTLPNLYCTPQDIFDIYGTEGGQLRLDDHSLSTGQVIIATAPAAQGATSLSVTALASPLLPGTYLEFDGGGMPAVAEVVLTALGRVGDTTLTVAPLAAAISPLAQAFDSGVNTALAQRLVKACVYGTSQVKLYCCPRYNDSDLVNSWSVNRWASALGARWLGRRRGQLPPEGIDLSADEAIEELKGVRFGVLNIEDIGTRTSGWPFLSNVTVDVGYNVTKVRVEQQISELTLTQYSQYVDWNSAFFLEW